MNELNELYEAIKDVVFTCENMELELECVKTLKQKYNNLCECEEEMEFFDGGDGVEWEVWINKKTNKKYVVPIQIQRFFEDAEELINQEW